MAIIGGGSDGTRLLPQMGNAGERTSYTLKDLPAGTYYWSVQAIDNGFAGSTFSSEGMFTVAFGDIGAGMPDVGNSSVAWGDYNADGRAGHPDRGQHRLGPGHQDLRERRPRHFQRDKRR